MRRDPGLSLLVFALVAATALYAPTIGRDLVNYDDPWLVRDNWIVADPSWASVQKIWLDLGTETRFVLGAEYLPVRDVSVMLDHVVWGTWYGGHHLTNLVLYLAAIALWFAALDAFGIDRRVLGVMALVWALHPSHAESVAWIAERKGLLGVMFSGAAGLAYARFRAGRSWRWLALGAIATACAVWSKAPSAFAIAALGGLEHVLPAKRASWRRSLIGLGVLAAFGCLAFVPVLVTALAAEVIGTSDHAPVGWLEMMLGIHGFYLRLSMIALRSSPSYAIAAVGPSGTDVAIGAIGLILIVAVAVVPTRGKLRVSPQLRAAAVLWLFGWFPASRLVFPMQAVLVADRYLLFPTLGLALAVGVAMARVTSPRARHALLATIIVALTLRALDAQSNWRDNVTLWQRAVLTSPTDGNAWSMYAEGVMAVGRDDLAFDVIREGLKHTRSPRLLLRKALLIVRGGSRSDAIGAMRAAANAGEPRAMLNVALLLVDVGEIEEAQRWATRATQLLPMHAAAYRALGKVYLAKQRPDLALVAYEAAVRFEPRNAANRYNLALALIALDRHDEAKPYLDAARVDPALGWRANKLLEKITAAEHARPPLP